VIQLFLLAGILLAPPQPASVPLSGEAAVVTLSGTDLSLSSVLAEISKQTGNRVVDHRAAFGQLAEERSVTVDFDKTPFWQALDAVLDQADLTLFGLAGERGAFVVNRLPNAQPRAIGASYSGAFRLQVVRVEANRDLRDEGASNLRLILELSWEPRLQPFSILQRLEETTALGPSGEAISLAGAQTTGETLVRQDFSSTEIDVLLQLPPRSTAAIQRLKGKLVALVPGALEEFRFSELPVGDSGERAKVVSQRREGTTLTVESVRKNNDVWEASLHLQFDEASDAIESHRSWMLGNKAFFEDSKGVQIESGGIEQTLRTKQAIGLKYYFDLPDGPQGCTFVYRTPLQVLELPVNYEFSDLRLP
jgi:hypothetical protein